MRREPAAIATALGHAHIPGMRQPTESRAVVPYVPSDPAEQQARVEAGFWAKVRRVLGRVPFLEEAAAAYYCATDKATPARVKAVLMGALAYFVVPTDLIPDFIASIGFTDDAAVLFLAIQTVTPHIKDHHRDQGRAAVRRLAGEADAAA